MVWLVDWWVGEAGIEHALRAASQSWTLFAVGPHGQPSWPLEVRPTFSKVSDPLVFGAARLRHHLARADGATWEAARRAAAELRAATEPGIDGFRRRVELTFLFPTHRPWVDEDLAELLQHPDNRNLSVVTGRRLSSCLHHIDQFDAMGEQFSFLPDCLPDLVHTFGVDLVPWLGTALHEQRVQIYRRYAKDIRAAMELLRSDDALAVPAYLDVEALTPLVDEHGGQWEHDRLVEVISRLATASSDADRTALCDLLQSVSPPARSQLAWELVEQWRAADVPNEDAWILDGLIAIGDDSTDRKLGELRWRTPTAARRAVDVLVSRQTDVAIGQVLSIVRSKAEKRTRDYARGKVDDWCAEHSLTRDQVEDRSVDDFGLRDADSLVFNFGPRQVHVHLDSELRTTFRDGSGTLMKSFPRGAKSDDELLAATSNARWKTIKSAISSIDSRQAKRLEFAMGSRRSWAAHELRTVFAEHPLLGSLARRIVWSHEDGGDVEPTPFRIAEDGSFTTESERQLTLDPEAAVRVLHPVRLSAEGLANWGEIFADYEMLQPFDQLARECHTARSGEIPTLGPQVAGGAMRQLTRTGWLREKQTFNGFHRSFESIDVRVRVRAEPHMYFVQSVDCVDQLTGAPLAWSDAPAELHSEVRYDFALIEAK